MYESIVWSKAKCSDVAKIGVCPNVGNSDFFIDTSRPRAYDRFHADRRTVCKDSIFILWVVFFSNSIVLLTPIFAQPVLFGVSCPTHAMYYIDETEKMCTYCRCFNKKLNFARVSRCVQGKINMFFDFVKVGLQQSYIKSYRKLFKNVSERIMRRKQRLKK